MLIRSQDKEQLLNIDSVKTIGICERGKCFAIFIDSLYFIGNYSSREKVIKVLDMIQEAYGDSEYTKYVIPEVCRVLSMKPKTEENKAHAGELGEMLKNGMTFQMPEDSEVEV
jgi:hypothetical protein|nr:MAG TPA: hypothetical protein [Caudoviricetes sp.]